MNITIVYFSQSGNTKKVARVMADSLRAKKHHVKCVSTSKVTNDDIENSDLLGYGTPVFESHAPTPVMQFLEKIPFIKDQAAFVFATSGGTPGRTLYDITRLLRSKGRDVVGGVIIRGEVHHPAPCLEGREKGHPNEDDFEIARKFAVDTVDHILSEDKTGSLSGYRDIQEPGWGFYDVVSLLTRSDALLRILLPRPKVNTKICIQCERCVTECPVGNISMQPHPEVGPECIRCYRCETACKENAFSSNWRFGNSVVYSLYNDTFARWFGDHGKYND